MEHRIAWRYEDTHSALQPINFGYNTNFIRGRSFCGLCFIPDSGYYAHLHFFWQRLDIEKTASAEVWGMCLLLDSLVSFGSICILLL